MSGTVNDDQKMIKKRKDSPVKEKASAREMLNARLMAVLKDKKFGDVLTSMWLSGNNDRQEYLDKQMTYMQDWDEFIDIDPQGLWESSSNLHIPVTFWTCKAYHARFVQTLLNPDPQFTIKARKASFQGHTPDIQDFLRFTMMDWANKRKGIDEALDQWLWAWVTTGIGHVKWSWHEDWKRYWDIEEREVRGPDRYDVDDQGNQVAIPTARIEENEVLKEEKVYEGPCLEFRSHEDILVVGRDVTDPASADAVFDRQFLTASDLLVLSDKGIFDAEAVEEIIQGGKDHESSTEGGEIKQIRAENAGDTSLDAEYKLDRYEILEVYCKADIDGSGINSDIVVWVGKTSGKLLRATFLHRINKRGLCPVQSIVFHKRSGQNSHHPIGLVEIMHPIAKEMDAMHNMRVDFGLIQNMPFGFYRASSSVDAKDIRMEPGTLYPVDDPQRDIHFPSMSNRTAWGFQEEASLMTMVERVTGISDLSLGVVSGKQGATRTATGSRLLAGETSANLDIHLKRLNRGWKSCIEYLLSLLQMKVPKGLEFRATGKTGLADYIKVVDANDLKGDYDIEVSPDSQDSNKMIQLQNADQILMMQQDPMAVQMGIINPQTYYEAMKNKLRLLGIKEVHKYINAEFAEGLLLTPEEELTRLVDGLQVKVLPNSDHEGFISAAQIVLQHQDSALPEESKMLIQAQIQQHQQMAQAVKQQQSQAANIRQMQFNSNLGQGEGNGSGQDLKLKYGISLQSFRGTDQYKGILELMDAIIQRKTEEVMSTDAENTQFSKTAMILAKAQAFNEMKRKFIRELDQLASIDE